jgi:hypothetical protein
VLQPCVGLGLFYAFLTAIFSGVGSLAPHTTPDLDYQVLLSLVRTCLALVALPEADASASIALRATGVRKSPLHDKAVVVEGTYQFTEHKFLSLLIRFRTFGAIYVVASFRQTYGHLI